MYLCPKDQSKNPTDKLQNETESQHVKKLQSNSKQRISNETETHAHYSDTNETKQLPVSVSALYAQWVRLCVWPCVYSTQSHFVFKLVWLGSCILTEKLENKRTFFFMRQTSTLALKQEALLVLFVIFSPVDYNGTLRILYVDAFTMWSLGKWEW